MEIRLNNEWVIYSAANDGGIVLGKIPEKAQAGELNTKLIGKKYYYSTISGAIQGAMKYAAIGSDAKANEFFKKHGLNKAKALLSTQGKTIANLKSEYTAEQLKEYQGYIVSDDLMSLVELKRLVESHELVIEHRSIDRAKMYAESIYTAPEVVERLKQAIADVESCMEVSNESN